MSRKDSILGELLEQLFELTGYFWQIGVAISALFMFFVYQTYGFVSNVIANMNEQPILAAVEKFSFILYLLPVSMFIISVIFAYKTYRIYHKQNHI